MDIQWPVPDRPGVVHQTMIQACYAETQRTDAHYAHRYHHAKYLLQVYERLPGSLQPYASSMAQSAESVINEIRRAAEQSRGVPGSASEGQSREIVSHRQQHAEGRPTTQSHLPTRQYLESQHQQVQPESASKPRSYEDMAARASLQERQQGNNLNGASAPKGFAPPVYDLPSSAPGGIGWLHWTEDEDAMLISMTERECLPQSVLFAIPRHSWEAIRARKTTVAWRNKWN